LRPKQSYTDCFQQAETIAKKGEVPSDLIGNPTLPQKTARRALDVLGQNGDASFLNNLIASGSVV